MSHLIVLLSHEHWHCFLWKKQHFLSFRREAPSCCCWDFWVLKIVLRFWPRSGSKNSVWSFLFSSIFSEFFYVFYFFRFCQNLKKQCFDSKLAEFAYQSISWRLPKSSEKLVRSIPQKLTKSIDFWQNSTRKSQIHWFCALKSRFPVIFRWLWRMDLTDVYHKLDSAFDSPCTDKPKILYRYGSLDLDNNI